MYHAKSITLDSSIEGAAEGAELCVGDMVGAGDVEGA